MSYALAIEDDPATTAMICKHLDGDNWNVHCVASLSDGLSALQAQRFDCIVLDLNLPDAAGLGTLCKILMAASGVPVVVLTGTGDATTATGAIYQGAVDYVYKAGFKYSNLPRICDFAIARGTTDRLVDKANDILTALKIIQGRGQCRKYCD